MDLQLNGKTALVTGASQGLGKAIAIGLAMEGVQVAITARVQTRSVDAPGSAAKNKLTSFLPGVQVVLWKLKFSGQVNFSNNNVARFGAIQVETAF